MKPSKNKIFSNNNNLPKFNKNRFSLPNEKITKPSNQNYLIWGKHALEAAILNDARRIIKIYHTNEMVAWLKAKLYFSTNFVENLIIVHKKLLDQYSISSPHQGVMAEVEPLEWQNLDGYLGNEDENKCLVLLDQLTNPQNIGSILRTASAFEVDGVVVTKRNTPIENGLMARSSSGAIETMPLIRISNLSRTIEYLKNKNFLVVGLEKSGAEDIKKISDISRVALVLGSENQGLRRLTKEKLSLSVKIPIAVQTESLNVSTAAAIALYVIKGQ